MTDDFDSLATALSDSYELQRKVGAGGMAIVYLARDLKHDRQVAVKVMRRELTTTIGSQRFLDEIRITARLEHPHILHLYDSGEAAGFLYYVMPYVEGQTLRDRLEQERSLPVDEAVKIARDVAGALDYAHRQGVVHRDIKPENILLSEGYARVTDFGIARAVLTARDERLTQTGLSLGTPAYMSPEQSSEGQIDGRSDIYSLACVLYEMLTGVPPFMAGSPLALLAKHAADPVPSLRGVRVTVPVGLDEAIVRALAKVPADRYRTAAEFAAALTGAPFPSGVSHPVPAVHLDPVTGPARISSTSFWEELRRRNVYKVAVVYGAVSWVLIQVAATAAPFVNISDQVVTWIIVAAFAGLPLALFLAWAYELTPDGLRATSPIRTGELPNLPQRRTTGFLPQRSGWLVVAGAAMAIGFAIVIWRVTLPAGPELNQNKVVVFPLLPASGAPVTQGEDAATMIGHALEDVEPLRWIDGWRLLDSEQRADVRQLSDEGAADLSRAQRAGFYLSGRIVASDSGPPIVGLTLYDVQGDSVAATSTGAASAEAVWTGGLTAVNKLLPTLIPGTDVKIDDTWTRREPAAVGRFLLGEQLARRGRYAQALAPYRRALAADSSFALAAMKGAMAYTWLDLVNPDDNAEALRLVQAALRSADDLAPRLIHFLRGFQAYLEGRADDAVLRLNEAIALDRDMTEAWLQLGETYRHLLPSDPQPDSLAAHAYGQALRSDSMANASLYHPLEFAIRAGDTATARRYLDRLLSREPGSALAWMSQLTYDCVADGPESVDWAQKAAQDPNHLVSAGWNLARIGAQIPCATAAFEAVLDREEHDEHSWYALLGVQTFLLAQGQDSVASARLRAAFTELDQGFFRRLVILDGLVDPRLEAFAEEMALFFEDRYGENYQGARASSWLWLFANWERHKQRPAKVEAISRAVEQRAQASGNPQEAVIAEALKGHEALARGDSSEAIRLFSALKPAASPDSIPWHMVQPLGMERLLLAQLHLARGDYRQALDVASLLDSPAPVYYLVLLRSSLHVRKAAAERLGDMRLASHFERRLAALEAVP
ncbi:MAG: protein kinase [Gemmatimonadota bacterium]